MISCIINIYNLMYYGFSGLSNTLVSTSGTSATFNVSASTISVPVAFVFAVAYAMHSSTFVSEISLNVIQSSKYNIELCASNITNTTTPDIATTTPKDQLLLS